MKLIDKIKNFFYDDEEVAVPKQNPKKEENEVKEDVKPSKEDSKSKTVEPKANVEDIISERELFRSEPTFKFPVIFEEEDFVEEKRKNNRINVLDQENNKIIKSSIGIEEKHVFKPTPIISPIYGIIDDGNGDNDKKVKENSLLHLYESSKTVNLDQVIEKAYSKIKTESENNKDKGLFFNLKEEEPVDLFKDMKEDEKNKDMPEKEHVEIDVEVNNNYVFNANDEHLKSIDELLENTNDQDFYTLVDNMYKNEEEENKE
jgi:hypothetical protein